MQVLFRLVELAELVKPPFGSRKKCKKYIFYAKMNVRSRQSYPLLLEQFKAFYLTFFEKIWLFFRYWLFCSLMVTLSRWSLKCRFQVRCTATKLRCPKTKTAQGKTVPPLSWLCSGLDISPLTEISHLQNLEVDPNSKLYYFFGLFWKTKWKLL